MFKLGQCVDGVWRRYSHPAIFNIEHSGNNQRKVLATVPSSDPIIFREMVKKLTAPMLPLYILHTPRGEGKPGRYQSSSINQADFIDFFLGFEGFFQTDSRFDLWAHSPTDRATVVWDRHDLIHVYGIVDPVVTILRGLGFQHGSPAINFIHQHHYHAENDEQALQLLSALDWNWSPLRPEDEQFVE